MVDQHLSELTPDDTPQSAMNKAAALVEQRKAEAFDRRLTEISETWTRLVEQLSAMDARQHREALDGVGFRHLRAIRKLLKDMQAEVESIDVATSSGEIFTRLKAEASALFGEAEATLTDDNERGGE